MRRLREFEWIRDCLQSSATPNSLAFSCSTLSWHTCQSVTKTCRNAEGLFTEGARTDSSAPHPSTSQLPWFAKVNIAVLRFSHQETSHNDRIYLKVSAKIKKDHHVKYLTRYLACRRHSVNVFHWLFIVIVIIISVDVTKPCWVTLTNALRMFRWVMGDFRGLPASVLGNSVGSWMHLPDSYRFRTPRLLWLIYKPSHPYFTYSCTGVLRAQHAYFCFPFCASVVLSTQ